MINKVLLVQERRAYHQWPEKGGRNGHDGLVVKKGKTHRENGNEQLAVQSWFSEG